MKVTKLTDNLILQMETAYSFVIIKIFGQYGPCKLSGKKKSPSDFSKRLWVAGAGLEPTSAFWRI
jgi:hypothetical protein